MGAKPQKSDVRSRPGYLRALGKSDPPQTITIGGREYRRIEIFKHDSWAATALYKGEGGKVICKFGRQARLLGFPMQWLGRRLARREAAIMRRLADIPNVPDDSGPVLIDGRPLDYAVAHSYIEGHPLGKRDQPGDDFFPGLRRAIAEIHARDMAYVDLNKRENIIIGDDGRPYLIDFQISFILGDRWPSHSLPMRLILRLLQDGDTYHLFKHIHRYRPDQLGDDERRRVESRPWPIRLHRMIAVPFRQLRRKMLVLLKVRSGAGRGDSEANPEDAIRRDISG